VGAAFVAERRRVYIGRMHVYEKQEGGRLKGHETLQQTGHTAPARCLCGKMLDRPVWALRTAGGAYPDVCDLCESRRPEQYVDMRASDGEVWHSVNRADLGHASCGEAVADHWIFYTPTGRPHKASRCADCETARANTGG